MIEGLQETTLRGKERANDKAILAIFEKMKQHRQKYDETWRTLDAFDRGEQWDISTIPLASWIPRPVTNYIYVVKAVKKASLTQNDLIGKILPLSPLDTEKINDLDKVKNSVWKRLKVKQVIRDTADRAILLGTGITYVGYEPEVISGGTKTRYEGELVIKNLDTTSFYIDPTAFNLKQARFCAVAERVNYTSLKNNFPNTVPKLKNKILGTHSSTDNGGEIYNRDYNTNQEDAITLLSFFYRNESGRIGVVYLANGVLIGSINDTYMKEYPFAILYNIKQVNDFFGKSICEMILDNQKIVNKVESIITTMGVMLQNPPTFVSVDSGIDLQKYTKYRNAPSTVWGVRGDPRLAVHIPNLPEIPTTLLELNNVAKQNIKEIAGLTEAYLGQSVGSLTTSTGVNSLIERSTIRDKDQMEEIKAYVEDLTRLIVDTLIETSTGERTFRIDLNDPNTNQSFDWITLNMEDYQDINYDFYIEAQPATENTAEKQQQDAMTAMQLQMQFQPSVPLITPEEFISAMNWSDNFKDTILKRLREDNIEKQKVQVLDIMNLAMEATNPESELYGTQLTDLIQLGLSILRPTEQKLGSTDNSVQQRQMSVSQQSMQV